VINTVLELWNRYRDAKTLRPQELYLETAYRSTWTWHEVRNENTARMKGNRRRRWRSA